MTSMRKKAALAAGAGILTVGLLGSAALAAFAPVAVDPTVESIAQLDQAAAPAERGGDKLKAILDGLVAKGVITQAQEDSILAAVNDSAGTHRDAAKHIYADLMKDAAQYLGLSMGDLKTKLPGTSLGALASATPGKSREGLIAALTDAVNAAIAKAQADGKLTTEQADKARTEAPEHIAKFVDHKYEQRPPTAARGPKAAAFIGDVFGATRDYLGITQQALMTSLRDGKSLGEIANATTGKSRDGLIAAITNAATAKIDKAQADGKLTAEQATQLKSDLTATVTQMVDRKGHGIPKR